jgi:spore germination cell wall hydrolase CwlJ-like protein
MGTRFGVKKRHLLIGATALSIAAAGVSLFLAFSVGDSYEYTTANSVTVERSPAGQAPQIRLDDATGQLFTISGKADRADYAGRATAAHHDPGNAQTPSAENSSGHGNIPIIAASFTPVEMIRGGPTRFASALQQQNVNREGKSDRLDPAQPVSKTAALSEAPQGKGVSAAMFLLSSPAGYEEQPAASSDSADVDAVNGKPNSAATWEDLISLARVTGGDGEKIEEGIFGNLTENEFRAREFRCMATAIYHEARGETVEGQVAVGQVIMTRVRSDYYPNTICGVVFQGQWNRNSCQFSFACDGRTDAPKDGKLWDVAIDVAKKVITGKAFIKEIAEATHYHATYVSPKWRKQMEKIKRIGVHVFYKAPFVRPLVASTDLDSL